MKVVIEIDDAYSNVLTITAVGTNAIGAKTVQTRVSAQAVDLSKTNRMKLGADGKWTNWEETEDGK